MKKQSQQQSQGSDSFDEDKIKATLDWLDIRGNDKKGRAMLGLSATDIWTPSNLQELASARDAQAAANQEPVAAKSKRSRKARSPRQAKTEILLVVVGDFDEKNPGMHFVTAKPRPGKDALQPFDRREALNTNLDMTTRIAIRNGQAQVFSLVPAKIQDNRGQDR